MFGYPTSAAAQPIPGSGPGRFDRSGRRSSDDPEPPRILSVSFETATIRSGRVAVAKIQCTGAYPEDVVVQAVTAGFDIQMLEERTVQDGLIIVGLRIHRRIGALRRLCLIRFSVGGSSATASITVMH